MENCFICQIQDLFVSKRDMQSIAFRPFPVPIQCRFSPFDGSSFAQKERNDTLNCDPESIPPSGELSTGNLEAYSRNGHQSFKLGNETPV